MVKTKNCLLMAAAVSTALVAQSASAFEFEGYFRSGVGSNSSGGDLTCFKLPGAFAKYRLGNECENYGELTFSETIYEGDDGSEAGVVFMYKFNDPGHTVVEGRDNGIVQNWAYIDNAFGGALEGAQFWAGKRYYMRRDVHINDYFYWNTQNVGGGVEDIDLGGAKFAYAYLRPNVDGQPATMQVGTDNDIITDPGSDGGGPNDIQTTLHDLRLYDIPANPGGSLMLGAQFTTQSAGNNDRSAEGEDGFMFNIEHTQDGVLGGMNRIDLQYSDGSSGLGGGVNINDPGQDVVSDYSAWQVVEQLLWQADMFSGQATAVYADIDDGNTWMSIGARPILHLNQHLSLALEVGYDQVDPDEGDSRNLTKVTFAPQISPEAEFFSRPVLRAFITYADWNDEAQDAGLAGGSGGTFGDDTDGFSYGLQAEAWW